MADHTAKVTNEKIKGIALLFRNGALVLGTAAVVRLHDDGPDLAPALWLAIATFMAYMGIKLLTLMEPED